MSIDRRAELLEKMPEVKELVDIYEEEIDELRMELVLSQMALELELSLGLDDKEDLKDCLIKIYGYVSQTAIEFKPTCDHTAIIEHVKNLQEKK